MNGSSTDGVQNENGQQEVPPVAGPSTTSTSSSTRISTNGVNSTSMAQPSRIQQQSILDLSSPAYERANPLTMHVVARPKNVHRQSDARKGKGRGDVFAGDDETAMEQHGNEHAETGDRVVVSNGENEATDAPQTLEPREALKQQFYAFAKHKKTLNTLIRNSGSYLALKFAEQLT